MPTARLRATLLFVVLLAGCGSRSGLGTSGQVEGTGGAGDGGGSATGGATTGGHGGAANCSTLTQAEPIVSIAQTETSSDSAPALIGLADDEERVVVAFERRPNGSPPAQLRHASFEPWAAWPKTGSVSPAVLTNPNALPLEEFVIGPSQQPGNFSALALYEEMLFVSSAVPATGSGTASFAPFGKGTPVFVSDGPMENRYLAGWLSKSKELYATVVDPAAGLMINFKPGCSPDGVVGAALRSADGWLIAHSNGKSSPAGGCVWIAGAGPPTRVDVGLIAGSAPMVQMGSEELSGPVAAVAVVPHETGAYVVARESGGSGSRIRWMRFDFAQSGPVATGDVSAPGESPSASAAGSVGDLLAVAYVTHIAQKSIITVRFIDPGGESVAQRSFEADTAGPIALVGSAIARSVVVAFGGGGATPTIQMVRLDCTP